MGKKVLYINKIIIIYWLLGGIAGVAHSHDLKIYYDICA